MSWFDSIVVQPIFNILLGIYALIPGNDFGVALIIFAVGVRLVMWPLIKKQLHQTKLQRKIQPELKKIKEKAAGNKQLEGQLMLELYRERGINPLAPLGMLIIQIPIFIALFQVITIIASHRERIAEFTYSFIAQLQPVAEVIAKPAQFNENLFGIIDLTKTAFHGGTIYWPLFILAILSAWLQYYQSKQIMPVPDSKRRLRDILKESAQGKQSDQSEMSAILGQSMIKIIPIVAFLAAVSFAGALVLFYAISSLAAIIQQHILLKEDVEEMEVLADKPVKTKNTAAKRAKVAEPAVIVSDKKKGKKVQKPIQKRRKGSKVK